MKIRFASVEDSAALLRIYAQYINTPITFECELPPKEEFAARIRDISREYPYLVCEEDGRIGTFHKTGYKCGKWQDVAWFEKAVAPYGIEPGPVVPICALPAEKLESILSPYRQ